MVSLELVLNKVFGRWRANDLAALLFLLWLVRDIFELSEEARRRSNTQGRAV